MTNLLTVDVEEWYHPNLAADRPRPPRGQPTNLERNLGRLLDLFERRRARATFFVVGSIAEEKPGLARMIRDAGHDVALHGWDHDLLYRQTPTVFEEDLQRSIAAVTAAIGRRPRGFRAPSWSMTRETTWAYDVMERAGLDYDASVSPFRTFLYGIPDAPRLAYHPRRAGSALRLLEIPMSTVRILGRNLPFSGGFFLRVLPQVVVERAMRRSNASGHPVVVYVHPWEIDPGERRLPLGPRDRFIQYAGVAGAWLKLDRLLETFRFTSIEAALDAGLLAGGGA